MLVLPVLLNPTPDRGVPGVVLSEQEKSVTCHPAGGVSCHPVARATSPTVLAPVGQAVLVIDWLLPAVVVVAV